MGIKMVPNRYVNVYNYFIRAYYLANISHLFCCITVIHSHVHINIISTTQCWNTCNFHMHVSFSPCRMTLLFQLNLSLQRESVKIRKKQITVYLLTRALSTTLSPQRAVTVVMKMMMMMLMMRKRAYVMNWRLACFLRLIYTVCSKSLLRTCMWI